MKAALSRQPLDGQYPVKVVFKTLSAQFLLVGFTLEEANSVLTAHDLVSISCLDQQTTDQLCEAALSEDGWVQFCTASNSNPWSSRSSSMITLPGQYTPLHTATTNDSFLAFERLDYAPKVQDVITDIVAASADSSGGVQPSFIRMQVYGSTNENHPLHNGE